MMFGVNREWLHVTWSPELPTTVHTKNVPKNNDENPTAHQIVDRLQR